MSKGHIVILIMVVNVNLLYPAAPGGTAASFLNYSPGARGSAMSDAFTSVADDAYSSYYNPAALVNVENLEFGASYNKSIENTSNQFVSFAYPYKVGKVYSISYSGLSYGDIQGYDAVGAETSIISPADKAVFLSYGRAFTKDEIERPVFSLGSSIKYISENLGAVSANALAMDFGALYSIRPDKYWLKEIPAQELRFAAVLRNLGAGLKFDKESSSLPRSLVLGASWHSHPWGAHKLILSVDNVFSNYDKYSINFGAEYFLYQLFGVRVGYQSNKYIGSNINFGFGFKLSFIDLDYSMVSYGELGNMQRIAMLFRFGNKKAAQPLKGEVARAKEAKLIAPKEKMEELGNFASDYLKLAEKNLEENNYTLAYDNLNKAFNLEPDLKNSKWGKISNRLNTIISSLKLKERSEKIKVLSLNAEQSILANQALKSYIYMEDQKAYLLAHISYGTDIKGDSIYEEILYTISDLIKLQVRRDEILPKNSWITQKLKKTASYFYVKQYNMVIKDCEEIILIDPSNHMAWTRLGSAYFMLGDRENAKKAFKKALEINPNDKVVREFLQEHKL